MADLSFQAMRIEKAVTMGQVVHTKISESRRVAIPVDLCQRYGLAPGDPVVLEPSDTGIIVRRLDDVIREVQAFFADVAPPDVLISDELNRDRRDEADRDARG
jgi:bifunctional DNA-binding transcriptional regulator/antitoxin component of YhaV-PrlF toxin-antitoxin module